MPVIQMRMRSSDRIPIHAVEVEQALVAALIVKPSLLKFVSGLVAADFYDTLHRRIYIALRSATELTDAAALVALREAGINVARDVLPLLNNCPHVTESEIPKYVDTIIDRSRMRGMLEACSSLVVTGKDCASADDLAAVLKRTTDAHTSRSRGMGWMTTEQILAPLPPPSWLCRHLQLAPGRPSCIAGHPGAGKTALAQALAVAVASGRSAFGAYHVSGPALVRHIDYDQGGNATRRRYQRLLSGYGVKATDVGDRLQFLASPALNLVTSSDYEWSEACDGAALLILDSLRPLLPGIDENSSDAQAYVARLTRVSEQTGCTIVLIHHLLKGPGDDRSPLERLRGSSGVAAALGSVWLIDGRRNEPKKVEHAKAHPDGGAPREPFFIAIEDVSDGENPRAGLHLGFVEQDKALTSIDEKRRGPLMQRLRTIVETNPGKTGAELTSLARGRRLDVLACLEQLSEDGSLVGRKMGRGRRWFVPGHEEVAE